YEHNWDGRGGSFGRDRRIARYCNKYVNLGLDQFGSEAEEAFRLFIRKPVLKNNILAIDVAKVSESFDKSAKRYLFLFGTTSVPENSNLGTCCLLLGKRRQRRR